MPRRIVLTFGIFLSVWFTACSDESDFCYPPVTIAAFCGEEQSIEACDCVSHPIDLVAYVDLANLPHTRLVTSPEHYANGAEMIGLVCESGGADVPESAYPPLGPSYPIRARLTGARIVKVMQPANGGRMPTWHLEIETADQVRYFHVLDDTTEVPIVRDGR